MPHRPTILALALIVLAAMFTLPFFGIWLLGTFATGAGSSWSYVLTSILILLLLAAVCLALPRFFRRR